MIVKHSVNRPHALILSSITVVGIVITMGFAIRYGASNISFYEIYNVISGSLVNQFSGDEIKYEIVWNLRLPRIIGALLVGAALAVSGAVLQTLVRNNVADPYILGAGPGAAFGAVVIMTIPSLSKHTELLPVSAFVGAMLALLLVLLWGRKNGVLTPNRMILTGVAVGYLLNASMNFLQLQANPTRLNAVIHWLLGSLSGIGWEQLPIPWILISLSIVVILFHNKHMDALLQGDEVASNLGIDVGKTRVLMLICASILTGSAVSIAGGVVFVGLLVPHICKLLVGYRHASFIPCSVFLGSWLLLAVDFLSRAALAPIELPISIFTALLGAPFFLWLLRKDSA